MLRVLRSLRVMPLAAALLMSALSAYGQDADADKAVDLLKKGMLQYRQADYAGAKATLLQAEANRTSLSDTQRKQLDETLRGLDGAIKKQLEANDAFRSGEKALKANDLPEARRLFRQVADNPWVAPKVRADAQVELGRIEARTAVQAGDQERWALAKGAGKAEPGKAAVSATPRAEDAVVAQVLAPKAPAAPRPVVVEAPKAEPKPAPAALSPRQEAFNAEMAQGNRALELREGLKAEGHFSRALDLMPGNEQAELKLEQARQLRATISGGKSVSDLLTMRRVAWNTAVVEMEKALARSREATRDPQRPVDFDNAEKEAIVARDVLTSNKGYCDSADEYRAWEMKVADRLKDISLRRAEWTEAEASKSRVRSEKEEANRVYRQAKARQEQIDELTRRAQTLLRDLQYEGAVQTLQEIVRLDPRNQWALYQLQLAKREVELRHQREIMVDDAEQTGLVFQDIRKSEIPWYLEIVYPNNWRELTLRRKGYLTGKNVEDEKTKITRQTMQNRVIRMDFEGQELSFVIDYLRESTDLPIHVKWKALQAAEIEPKTQVTLKLKNVTAEKALKVLLDDLSGTDASKKLTYTIDEGVITISTGADLKGRVVTRTYDIRDMLVTVPSFVGPRIDVSKLGQNQQQTSGSGGIFGSGSGTGGGTGGGLGGDTTTTDSSDPNLTGEGTGRETRKEIIDKMKKTIRRVIDPTSWKAEEGGGGGGETGDALGSLEITHGQLIVTQTPANQEALVKLLADLREAQTLQVLVESRWLTVKSGWLERIGVDVDFTFGPDVHPLGRKVVFNNNQILQNHNQFVTNMDSGGAAGIASEIGSSTGITVAGQFLDDLQVDFLIQATQATRDSRILSAPRLMLMDGQRSYITIGTQQAYVSGFVPTVSENVSALQPIVSWVPSGVVLDVEATVSADRRYVTMTVRPQTSQVLSMQSFGVGAGAVTLPTVALQDLQSTVTVPDGGTVVLGGMKSSSEQEREIGVPILSKVPVVNRLFTNRGMVRDAETLLILVSPKIIIHKEMEEIRFPPPTPSAISSIGGG